MPEEFGLPLRARPRPSTRGIFSSLASTLVLCAGCGSPETPPPSPPPPPPPPPIEHVPPPLEEKPAPSADLGVVILSDVGFQTPESVLYDAEQDVYFVSNINGAPLDVDGNGFISRVTPEGEITLKFIEGGASGVELDAPKGLAVSNGVLYVADINRVRKFDAKTGAPQGEIKLPGSTFVNDVAIGVDGSVYASDSGLKKDFSSSGTDAVYKITKDKPKKIAANKKLGGPNGLLPDTGGTWVVTFGSGELYFLTDAGKQEQIQKLPKGQNDGVVLTKDGRVLVSSWEGSSVLVGEPSKDFVELVSGVESPADIGYDTKRNRLLIPLFTKNSVVLHTLDAADAPPPNGGEATPAR